MSVDAEFALEPVLLSPDEVATRLRDICDERARVMGPTPDLDPVAVASYLQELENETRLLLQIQGLQQNMLLLQAGILTDDQSKGQAVKLSLTVLEAESGKKNDLGREVHLQLGDYQVMKLKIGDWCSLINRTAPPDGVPVELEILTEDDDEAPPPLKAS